MKKKKKRSTISRKLIRIGIFVGIFLCIITIIAVANIFSEKKKEKTTVIPIPTSVPTPTKFPTPTLGIIRVVPSPTINPNFRKVEDPSRIIGAVDITCKQVAGFAFYPEHPEMELRYNVSFKPVEPNEFMPHQGFIGFFEQQSPDVNAFYNIIGKHRFIYEQNTYRKIDKPVEFRVYVGIGEKFEKQEELPGSPKTLTCPPKDPNNPFL